MINNVCALILFLLSSLRAEASDLPEASSFYLHESSGRHMSQQILDDAHQSCERNPHINIGQIVRTVKICTAYHDCLEELMAIYMPEENESLPVYLARNSPSKVKKLTAQVILKANQESESTSLSAKGKRARAKKKQDNENFSALEHPVLNHIYRVWNHGEDELSAKEVIRTYLDLPYTKLVASYEIAKTRELLDDYFTHAFTNGCIALKSNALEKWCQVHQKKNVF